VSTALLADAVLIVHGLFVLFVVGGFGLILAGANRWSWVRNRAFRIVHFAAIVLVAVEALLERDAARAQQVIDGDRVIDSMEVELEEQCLNLLALQQPMARDLRTLVSALKIATDLERVGDHAVNIANRIRFIATGVLPEHEAAPGSRDLSAIAKGSGAIGAE